MDGSEAAADALKEAQTLGEAIAAQPPWLLAWVGVLIATHLLAAVFLVQRRDGAWHFRWEPAAIVASFVVAAVIMETLHGAFGYVRLLGLAHLVGWTPIYAWMLRRRGAIGFGSWWGRYVHLYLGVAGTSLAIDAIDLARYLAG